MSNLTGDYTIDASHTRLGFSARHAMVTKVRGNFESFEGTAHISEENPADSWVKLDDRRLLDLDRQRRPRRPPQVGRLLRRRDLPDLDLQLDLRLARR
ncbi:MAG: YceI family protein [Nocardioides sp.]